MSLEDKVLELLRREMGRYVSGTEIATILGVSRMAVNKAVSNLRKRGFLIEAHPRLGYRLLSLDDLRLLESYLRDLATALRYKVIYMEEVASTQDMARALAEEGAAEGTIVIAEEQSSGRGRLGRPWISPRGGLWFTILLRPRITPSRLALISLLSSVAIALGVMDITGLKPRLKWPNDVILKGRKLAGVLVEASVEADVVRHCLVGVGVNVNNKIPIELEGEAISLKEVLEAEVPRVVLMRSLIRRFDELYVALMRGMVRSILDVWRSLSDTLGRKVRVLSYQGELEGIATDIDEEGALILRIDKKKMRVRAGDVIYLRSS
ncbi:MAG: biotin--[acetyl-CoA-carboxylase] ligase [Thermoprotei archaeon]|nr:MAG: biotin--[acetyl-CoA-carboxylase] ligase [Thermoprotei archaeon]RLF25308.1 MAG: biotin--[acetyl-CoA-carboxylase] ligase [Thermoprotei archaeon]